MAGNRPDEENHHDWIDQSKEQTAVEGWRGPKRGWRLESEGMRKQGLVGLTSIAEEAVHCIEELGQPACVYESRIAAFRQASPKPGIG